MLFFSRSPQKEKEILPEFPFLGHPELPRGSPYFRFSSPHFFVSLWIPDNKDQRALLATVVTVTNKDISIKLFRVHSPFPQRVSTSFSLFIIFLLSTSFSLFIIFLFFFSLALSCKIVYVDKCYIIPYLVFYQSNTNTYPTTSQVTRRGKEMHGRIN